MKTKICKQCGIEKQLNEYYIKKSNLDGHKLQCKVCCRENDKKRIQSFDSKQREIYDQKRKQSYLKNKKTVESYRKNNCEKIRETKKRYYESLEGKFNAWKVGANRRGIPWALEYQDVDKMPLVCYYTKEALTLKRNEMNTVSLDRKDSSKGYTKENIVFCSAIINRMKTDLNIDDFVKLCKKIAANA